MPKIGSNLTPSFAMVQSLHLPNTCTTTLTKTYAPTAEPETATTSVADQNSALNALVQTTQLTTAPETLTAIIAKIMIMSPAPPPVLSTDKQSRTNF